MDRRAVVKLLGTAAVPWGSGLGVRGSEARRTTPESRTPIPEPLGRLKQSVSRWPYRDIPLPDFCKAAAGMGLAAIDLLNPEEWDIVHDCGLVCSMGYPASRRDFIPTGFNDRANTRCCCASSSRRSRSPPSTESRM